MLRNIEESFYFSGPELKKIINDFKSEMVLGLRGEKSSLKMIPAFVDRPTGNERGRFIALDLGGTNFRILELLLSGRGKVSKLKEKKFLLPERCIRGSATELFGFIAKKIKEFSAQNEEKFLGFTFSFPVKQVSIKSGILLHWTKGFSVKGVEGRDVIGLLEQSLRQEGLDNIKVSALANDTVGTLIARAYNDHNCDVGVIWGTGTNACYREDLRNIKKYKSGGKQKQMIINTEWGNFNKLKASLYDFILDRASLNPGAQMLEKMVSGMYQGEISRLVILDLIKDKFLLSPKEEKFFRKPGNFKTEYMSVIEADKSLYLSSTLKLLKSLGIQKSSLEDRLFIQKCCVMVSLRAARISAAVLLAVIFKIDPKVSRRHTVAVDGSVFEKHPSFSVNVAKTVKGILKEKYSKIKLVLTKDGSGTGAAIIAALGR